MIRSVYAWCYRIVLMLSMGLDVRDVDCAFKLLPRAAYTSVKPPALGWSAPQARSCFGS
ncbi:MAG: hypothetical protein IH874_06205 [Candidatus Dadabacteria bacterium]|nr:hypothetical protein [Candidatus Dadabacteria bacterium]